MSVMDFSFVAVKCTTVLPRVKLLPCYKHVSCRPQQIPITYCASAPNGTLSQPRRGTKGREDCDTLPGQDSLVLFITDCGLLTNAQACRRSFDAQVCRISHPFGFRLGGLGENALNLGKVGCYKDTEDRLEAGGREEERLEEVRWEGAVI